MITDGVVVILSYPDTVVRPAHSEFSSKIWPLLGIGGKNGIQAGHAAMLLISKETRAVDYYDFGRYITSYGNGRVRSKESDPELYVPIMAEFKNNKLNNIGDLLLWLEAHPEKTHGEGRLIASVNSEINYTKALNFVENLISQEEIPYGAFVKNGSNCARFITDTILNSCNCKKIKLKLKTSNLLTPSPIGNTIKGTTEKEIYEVSNQVINYYTNTSVLKEYGVCFLKKINKELNLIGTELPNKSLFNLKNGTWLGGIGSGAWFQLEEKDTTYLIKRYTSTGEQDFEGVFKTEQRGFCLENKYFFVYPTNCQKAYIKQDNQIFVFFKINS